MNPALLDRRLRRAYEKSRGLAQGGVKTRWAVLAFTLTGCTLFQSPSYLSVGKNHLIQKRIDPFLKDHPFGPNDTFQLAEIHRTQEQSVHLVRIRTEESPHRHALHDVTVFMQKGQGTLYLKGQPVKLQAGDIVTIPKEVTHYYVNRSTQSVTQAVVVFSPPFDGKDTIPVKLPKHR